MEVMERVIRLDEQVKNVKECNEKLDRRMQDVEGDVSEIKVTISTINQKLDTVCDTASETRTDIQKAQRWFIVAIVTMIMSVVASVLIKLLS